MSSKKEDMTSESPRQDNSPPNSQIDYRNELYRLLCCAVRLFLLTITEQAARNVGRRIELLSQSAWLPGQVDKYGVAARLDMEERGAEGMLSRNNVPLKKPGATSLYNMSDITEKWETTGESCAGVAQPPKTSRRPVKRKTK